MNNDENNRIAQTPTQDTNTPPEAVLSQLEGNTTNSDSNLIANKVERDENGRLKKGSVLNPNGIRSPKNFDTLFEEALKRIADTNNTDPDKFDIDIVAKGLEMARKGDYRFWKDLLDRRFGKAQDKIDHTSGGEKIGGTFNIVFDDGRKQD